MLPPLALRSLVVAVLLSGLLPAASRAAAIPNLTYTVNTTLETDDSNPGNGVCIDAGGKCSLRAALMEANAHAGADTITLPSGTYSQTKELSVSDSVVINGAGRVTTIIVGAGPTGAYGFAMRGVTLTLELNGLTLTRFQKAIYTSGAGATQVEIQNSDLRANVNTDVSSSGSAVANFCSGCAVGVHASYLYDNQSPACGAVSNKGALVMDTNTQAHGNRAVTTYGGAICNAGGTVSLSQVQIWDNHADSAASAYGGAIYSSSGDLVIDSSAILSNSASLAGGGVYLSGGSLKLQTVVVGANSTQTGGGIFTGPSTRMVMDNVTVHGNGATGGGGGGIYGWDTIDIKNSAIVSNTAVKGGGLHANGGTTTLTNTTISGNNATQHGAGIYTYNDALVRLANATIANNTADSDDDGDGTGGGVYQDSSSVIRLKNTILAGNEDLTVSMFELYAPDCHGTITSDGYNLIGLANLLCSITGNPAGNLVGVLPPGIDPRLGPLTSNGQSYYHPLRFGPSIDRGNLAGCADYGGAILARDQAGNTRPYGSAGGGYTPRCDIGAIEAAFRRFDTFAPLVKR